MGKKWQKQVGILVKKQQKEVYWGKNGPQGQNQQKKRISSQKKWQKWVKKSGKGVRKYHDSSLTPFSVPMKTEISVSQDTYTIATDPGSMH